MATYLRHLCAAACILLACFSASLRAEPTATSPTAAFRAYRPGDPDNPQAAGFHKLIFEYTEAGQTQQIPFSIFLPSGYGEGAGDRRWPMLTFLGGLGDRGPDPGVSMGIGVPLEIGRDPDLRHWMPMIVLTPQCPSDRVWETPGMSQVILRLVNAAADHFAVDRSRLYVTGFSNGGRGAWVMAADAPNLFAVTAPIVSREHNAEDTAARLSGTGITCLVISGQADRVSEPASANMVAAMRKQGIDTVYAPVPNGQHFIWAAFYREKAFYEFLLQHQKGQAPAANRLTGEQIVALYTAREQEGVGQIVFDHRIQHELDRFEQYWFVDNCANQRGVGLQRQILGKQNIYVTAPLSREVTCRLQTTRPLPRDKWTRLTVEVGHPPKGEWELIIRVNEQEFSRILINDETAPGGWYEEVINLQSLAGQEARLQLIQQATTNPNPLAYWSKIKLTEVAPR